MHIYHRWQWQLYKELSKKYLTQNQSCKVTRCCTLGFCVKCLLFAFTLIHMWCNCYMLFLSLTPHKRKQRNLSHTRPSAWHGIYISGVPKQPNKNTGFTHLHIGWNPRLEGYCPQISVLSALCPQLNLLNPLPPKKKFLEKTPMKKIPGYATDLHEAVHIFWWWFPSYCFHMSLLLCSCYSLSSCH
jgi:hypothetical protein